MKQASWVRGEITWDKKGKRHRSCLLPIPGPRAPSPDSPGGAGPPHLAPTCHTAAGSAIIAKKLDDTTFLSSVSRSGACELSKVTCLLFISLVP